MKGIRYYEIVIFFMINLLSILFKIFFYYLVFFEK